MFDSSVIDALAQPRPDDTKQWLFSALLFGSRPVGTDFVRAPPSVESFPRLIQHSELKRYWINILLMLTCLVELNIAWLFFLLMPVVKFYALRCYC